MNNIIKELILNLNRIVVQNKIPKIIYKSMIKI